MKTWKWASYSPATPLTLLVAHRVRELVNVQVQRSGKMKIWGGSRTQRANILNSRIVFCLNSTCSFGPLVHTRNAFANGREPADFQPRAEIKRLFEELELVSGVSESIRKFSDKYIVPEKLVAEYVEHLAQVKMRKEKMKEETERERMERLNREYNDIDWVGLYNSYKLSSLRMSYPCTFPITRSPSKGRKLKRS